MCCLKYEQDAYSEMLRLVPGAEFHRDDAAGQRDVVTDQNLLTGTVNVRLDSAPDASTHQFQYTDVKVLKSCARRRHQSGDRTAERS